MKERTYFTRTVRTPYGVRWEIRERTPGRNDRTVYSTDSEADAEGCLAALRASLPGGANGPSGGKDNQGMDNEKKTVVADSAFYTAPVSFEDGSVKHYVWKNNGPRRKDTSVAYFATAEEAEAYCRRLLGEDGDGANEDGDGPENQGMNANDIDEIVSAYLADNPETAKRLVAAARQHDERRRKKAALETRAAELSEANQGLIQAIQCAQDAINRLKGEVLRLQKEKKQVCEELTKAQGELRAFS